MKCIKYCHTGKIHRVSDSRARTLVGIGRHSYCPKQEWKETRREAAAARAKEQASKAPAPDKKDRGKWNKKTKKYEKQ